MDWIKLTPETMPPDMEPVLATMMDMMEPPHKNKSTRIARLNAGKWEVLFLDSRGIKAIYLDDYSGYFKIVCWMPIPEPLDMETDS